MTSNFIDLGRRFSIVEKDAEKDPDRIKESFWSSTPTVGWSDLLQQYRVVILSEPGAGKTEEFQHAARIKKNQGEFSFFIRLELVEDYTWEDCFGIDTSGEFDQWLGSSDLAWLFLDSVDEARLSDKKNFEKALLCIARKLGQSKSRVHIFISSRVQEWLATSDLELFDRLLPGPYQQNVHSKEYIDQSINGQTEGNSPEATEPLAAKVYQLQPLNREQIRGFSEFSGVANTTLFLDEIDKSNSEIFANRPQDLLDLNVFWQKYSRLGKHEEMLDENIRRKLIENHPGHDDHGPLSPQQADYGIQILAAAATLQKKSTFLLPDKNVPTDRQTIAIEAKEVLNWTSKEINTLLGRAVFDPAIYGTVRFHHRSVREYLTAKWLQRLLEQGNKSRREVERLLFANQYGEDIVISSMRPVAAWLALWDNGTRLRLREISPDLLLRYGDPSSLELEFRKTLLKRFIAQYAENVCIGDFIEINVLKRFADPELASTINQLFSDYETHEKLCIFLLKLVWHGKIDGAIIPVKKIAINPKYSSDVRIYAIWAIAAIGQDETCRTVIESLLVERASLEIKLIDALLENFYPNDLSIEELLKLIKSILNPKKNSDFFSLERTLQSIFKGEVHEERQYQLLDGVISLIEKEPWIQRPHCKFSQHYSWLITHIIELSVDYIKNSKNRSLTTRILSFFLNFCISSHSGYIDRQSIDNLKELLSSLPEIGYELFWQTVEHCRKSEIPSADIRFRVTFWLRDIWIPSESHLERFIQAISDRSLMDDRLIALSIVFSIYESLQCPRTLRERLIRLVKSTEELNGRLNQYLSPILTEEQERKLDHETQQQKYRAKKQEKKEQMYKQEWRDALRKTEFLDRLRNVPGAKDGITYDPTIYLYRYLQENSRENKSSRLGYANWSLLEDEFGEVVALAFRDGCKKYWREYNPYSYPNWRKSNDLPHSRTIGLTGLEIEAKDNPNWAKELSPDECKAAACYLPFELNGFPDWYQALFEISPEEFDSIIYEELRWEIYKTPDEHLSSRILSKLSYGDFQLKKRYQEFILKLLEEKDVTNTSILQSSLSLILEESNDKYMQRLQKLAIKRCNKAAPLERQQIWLRTLFCVDPVTGITHLKLVLSKIKNRETSESWMLQFCAKLGRDNFLQGKLSSDNDSRESFLRDFLPLVYRYINPELDVKHDGPYSPDDWDEAQTTRYWLTEALVQTSGKVSYDTLKALSISVNTSYAKDYLAYKARERAELDAESQSGSNRSFSDLSQTTNWVPTSSTDLFKIALARLDDLKIDLEEGDASIAKILKEVKQETDIRNWLARDLRLISRNHYEISQEEEFSDAKRTDIRFTHPRFEAVPVELKIAEKWSYSQLKERLENQLVKQYMRVSPYGIFLLVYNGGKSYWSSPKRLYFKDLIIQLKQDADSLTSNYPHVKEIQVIGLDCTLRHQESAS